MAAGRFCKGQPPTAVVWVINNCFHNWGHRYIYDLNSLSETLRAVGFCDVIESAPGKSDELAFRNIDSHGLEVGEEFSLLETVVVEASKPR